jgi:hypothetical protein
MIIVKEKKAVKENALNEAQFKWNAVKSCQVSGTKVKISIEVDLAKGIKEIAGYDIHRYDIAPAQLAPEYLGEAIARQLDWNAYALSVNDDHELSHLLAELND